MIPKNKNQQRKKIIPSNRISGLKTQKNLTKRFNLRSQAFKAHLMKQDNKLPKRHQKTLKAIENAWAQSPHSSLGQILCWIASIDKRKRGNQIAATDSARATGVYRTWGVKDHELKDLADKWTKRQKARPKKKPALKFPRVKSLDK